ncbi:LytTR family DNA-binding domain-containing protein [Spirosoma sp. KNUC1025]|uniref:LytR/AlgR family response regulator transcription factor n=1 Tax=Spirosoma sp. KNUC1025 TaxID=2894082 RepID=UPI0038679CC1|nr:LytTR family DNA-binding domain-containing protein [Spirosoma sp. KNUC1025]
MIRAIALDDEPPALRVITRFCEQIDFVDLQKTFSRTDQALTYLEQFPVDLLFLDINMPSMSGIDFYKSLPQQAVTTDRMVIFTTAHAEHAVEGFNLNAVDYLLKPFTFDRFLQAATRASDYYQFLHAPAPARHTYIYIRADYRLNKIAVNDIVFIEGLDDYLKIHVQNSKPIVTRMTMKAILQKLDETEETGEGFLRVHRSYIVPVSRIEAIKNKSLLIAGQEIPIGASYEADFQKRFPA